VTKSGLIQTAQPVTNPEPIGQLLLTSAFKSPSEPTQLTQPSDCSDPVLK